MGKNKSWYRWDRIKDGQLTEKNFADTLGTGYGIVWNERGEKKSEGGYNSYQQDGEWIYYPWKNSALYDKGRYVKQLSIGKKRY